jgi:hypothetical protein
MNWILSEFGIWLGSNPRATATPVEAERGLGLSVHRECAEVQDTESLFGTGCRSDEPLPVWFPRSRRTAQDREDLIGYFDSKGPIEIPLRFHRFLAAGTMDGLKGEGNFPVVITPLVVLRRSAS